MTASSGDINTDSKSVSKLIPPASELMRIYIIGIFMGTADAVPGVSGGTIALIAGIYDRLIDAVTSITFSRLVDVLGAVLPFGDGMSADGSLENLERIDACFLIVLVAGIGTAVVLVGQVVEYVKVHAPVLLFGFFFGLIGASAIVLWGAITIHSVRQALAGVTGFTVAFVLSGEVHLLESGGGFIVIFVAGAIAVSAMILPGISGSLLLVILGQYTRMYDNLGNFIDGLVSVITGGAFDVIVSPGQKVMTFLVGGIVGLFTISRVVQRMLDVYQEATLAFLVAMVVGALRAPITELSTREGFVWTTTTVGEFSSIAVVGALLVLILDWQIADLNSL